MSGLGALAIVLGTFGLAVVLYFVPTIVAKRRGHRNYNAILVANVFLGWTGIFWVLILVWALMEEKS